MRTKVWRQNEERMKGSEGGMLKFLKENNRYRFI
jgi:hypothetical protein